MLNIRIDYKYNLRELIAKSCKTHSLALQIGIIIKLSNSSCTPGSFNSKLNYMIKRHFFKGKWISHGLFSLSFYQAFFAELGSNL